MHDFPEALSFPSPTVLFLPITKGALPYAKAMLERQAAEKAAEAAAAAAEAAKSATETTASEGTGNDGGAASESKKTQ